jgi:hypothetical protein
MMQVPTGSLTLSLAEAAARQTNAAIAALEAGMFDISMTLAGAAEGMIKREGPHMFQGLRAAPRALERFTTVLSLPAAQPVDSRKKIGL